MKANMEVTTMRSPKVRLLLLFVPFLLACSLLAPAATATASPTKTATLTPKPTVTRTFTPTRRPTKPPTPDLRIVNPQNQHTYLVSQFQASWRGAKDYCLAVGGHLATIQSEEENRFVSRLAPYIWLGASDVAQEGAWVWVTGEPWSYSHWSPGEPNNCCPAENCGPQECTPESFLTVDSSGEWNDTPDGQMFFVCEWDQSP